MSFSTLENQIKTEYGVVKAWIALHPWSHSVLMVAAGFAGGFFAHLI